MLDDKKRVSFVLPFTLDEKLGSTAWRNEINSASEIRLKFLLHSFVKMFDFQHLDRFILISPHTQRDDITLIVNSIVSDNRFIVLPENEVCPELFSADMPKLKGWYIQQLIKLSIHKEIKTSFYVTLDSDIFCPKSFSYATLIHNNRANMNIEMFEDYKRVYNDNFASKELQIKEERYKGSAKMLNYDRVSQYQNRYYGETPVVTHTQSVENLTKHLEKIYEKSWIKALGKKCHWTEYSLYFQYLELSGELEKLYYECDCNTILDLERSVWQPRGCYKRMREYDWDHFNKASGCFVAIQSWLDTATWLPSDVNLEQFYLKIQKYVLENN